MNCRISRRRLSGYIDGDLGPSDASALRDHVQSCGECQRTTQHLRRLKAMAAELGDLEPPADLLQRTLAQLDREPPSRRFFFPTMVGTVAVAAGVAGVFVWSAAFDSMPSSSVLAGGAAPASTVAVPGKASVAGGATPGGQTVAPRLVELGASDAQFQAAEQHYRDAVSSLRGIAARESIKWSAARRERFGRDLALFDGAVNRSGAAVGLSGLDPQTRELHFAAYRQQIRYLQDVILSGVAGPPTRQMSRGRPAGTESTLAMPAAWQP